MLADATDLELAVSAEGDLQVVGEHAGLEQKAMGSGCIQPSSDDVAGGSSVLIAPSTKPKNSSPMTAEPTKAGIVLDTAGRYTTQDSHQAEDKGAWESFLGLLKKVRPRRPLNGGSAMSRFSY